MYLLIYLNIYSQELSPIQSFKVDDYNASGQNWMISQSSNGDIFFANNDGTGFFQIRKSTINLKVFVYIIISF